jgi:SAM-dependent methyltransferase
MLEQERIPEGARAMPEAQGLTPPDPVDLDIDALRSAIREEYEIVALDPGRGFHFHTGRRLAAIVGYEDEWLEGIPETSIESFAGTGNPFSLGELRPGERVVDVGSGGGIDSLIAVRKVGPEGRVIGIDMTPAMLERAQRAAVEAGLENVEFREGVMDDLPVEDGWADVVISNGVLNLTPDKLRALAEMNRVLKPGGRLQVGDILVEREVSAESKRKIDLWTG